MKVLASVAVLVVVSLLAVSCVGAGKEEVEMRAFLEEMRSEHPVRTPKRELKEMSAHLSDRVGLFFRALDKDHDKMISEEDVKQSEEEIKQHLPGVSMQDFLEFIEMADKDGDKKLNHIELHNGMAEGLEQAGLLQVEETVPAPKKGGRTGPTGVSNAQDSCVMCQYIVERCETNVKQSGVIGSMATAAPSGVYLELDTKVADQEDPAFLEVKTAALDPFDVAGAQIIGSTRQSTRYQRLLERQKFNEIYRVVDITLDDVCEQGMPNSFYGYCKQVYKVQSDVVDGLRYQYRPADICFRIGMCKKGSYITQGIHSRYK